MRKQAIERPDLIILCIDPGWVNTGKYISTIMKEFKRSLASSIDMGGEDAPLTAPESASNVIQRLTEATTESSGKAWVHDGTRMDW